MNSIPFCPAILAVSAALLLAACGAPAGTPPVTVAPSAVTTPTSAASAAPTAAPPVEPSVGVTPRPASVPYIDDRSGPAALIDSFYNAIGRREYARAYGYWEPNAEGLAPYEEFKSGYGDTSAVAVTYGPITSDAGAGQLRYAVPVALTADAAGGQQFFVGCYTLHLASPAAQATPPFRPLAIERAVVQQENAPASGDSLAQACQNQGAPPPTPAATSGGIGADAYIDDRSDAPAVLRSFYNAINRREYLRAYAYWQDASQIPPLADFAQGYANTREVALVTGEAQGDAGAGQQFFRVPVTISAQQADGSTRLFAGCYTLHLASPAIQEPPFESLGIVAAAIQPASDAAAADAVMAQGCQPGQ
jgi:hypothetical protein